MQHDVKDQNEPGTGETFQDILSRRIARRSFLKGALVTGSLLAAGSSPLSLREADANGGSKSKNLRFRPIALETGDRVLVPDGYQVQVLIRWGDPLFFSAPTLDVNTQNGASQTHQFGYNCDYVSYFPLGNPFSLKPLKSSQRGLLAVNNEFTNPELMFPGYTPGNPTSTQVEVELAAHGVSIVEVHQPSGKKWKYIKNSSFNRRISAETEIIITGPAAGHEWLKVSYDPTGTRARGTLNNCAGGKTPWGTLLSCEENFNQYFANRDSLADDDPRKALHTRYGLTAGASDKRWENFHPRFNLALEPNEPFRFGWVVEIDPYNPGSVPRKHTALGRTKHEAATVVISKSGHAVVYSGDDERFDYMYKFVSQGTFNTRNRTANFELLDAGTLYVAKFNDDGAGEWIPVVFGQGPLTPENGFNSQADVLINTRGAADLLGVTKMDRPEDIETNPVNGKVYCVFTNNTNRGAGSNPGPDAANPRTVNRHGHIIELTEDGNDAAATTFTWEIFLLCGDPDNPAHAPTFFAGFDPSQVSAISSPDNIVFDNQGNLWIATDGQPGTLQKNDGFYAMPVEGSERGFLRQFLSVPTGAETCGPEFTPDNETLFIAVQHPGEGSGSTLNNPISRWPDGDFPRPSVIVVTKKRGSQIIGR